MPYRKINLLHIGHLTILNVIMEIWLNEKPSVFIKIFRDVVVCHQYINCILSLTRFLQLALYALFSFVLHQSWNLCYFVWVSFIGMARKKLGSLCSHSHSNFNTGANLLHDIFLAITTHGSYCRNRLQKLVSAAVGRPIYTYSMAVWL